MSDKFYTYKKEDNQKHASLQEYSTINADGILDLGVPTATPITPINNNIKSVAIQGRYFKKTMPFDLILPEEPFTQGQTSYNYTFSQEYNFETDFGANPNGYCNMKLDIEFKSNVSTSDVANWYDSLEESYNDAFIYVGKDSSNNSTTWKNPIYKTVSYSLEDTNTQSLFCSVLNPMTDCDVKSLSQIGFSNSFVQAITNNSVVNKIYVTIFVGNNLPYYVSLPEALTNGTGMLLGFSNAVFLENSFEIILNQTQARLEITYKNFMKYSTDYSFPSCIGYYADDI